MRCRFIVDELVRLECNDDVIEGFLPAFGSCVIASIGSEYSSPKLDDARAVWLTSWASMALRWFGFNSSSSGRESRESRTE